MTLSKSDCVPPRHRLAGEYLTSIPNGSSTTNAKDKRSEMSIFRSGCKRQQRHCTEKHREGGNNGSPVRYCVAEYQSGDTANNLANQYDWNCQLRQIVRNTERSNLDL